MGSPEGFRSCPLYLVPTWWRGLRLMGAAWERGLPAVPGAYYQQPATFVEAMSAMQNSIAEFSKDLLDEKRRKHEQRA